jgi:hypothetical protein
MGIASMVFYQAFSQSMSTGFIHVVRVWVHNFNFDTIQYRNVITLMTNPEKKPPGRPRSIKSDKAILQAALELLAEVGCDRMSIDAIATRAGVGKSAIAHRRRLV